MLSALFALALSASPTNVDIGPVTFVLHDSRTASIFHALDQISGWTQWAHPQYKDHWGKTLALTKDEQALLDAHADLRRRIGYGKCEQAFYTDADLPDALLAAKKIFTPEEWQIESRMLIALAPKVDRVLEPLKGVVQSRIEELRVQADRIKPLLVQSARFAGVRGAALGGYLIPSPGEGVGGGGFNGGVLTVEVTAKGGDHVGVFVHEAFHALMIERQPLVEKLGQALGYDFETASEAMAHVVYPGIFNPNGDELERRGRKALEMLARAELPPARAMNDFLALALRPLLRELLADPNATFDNSKQRIEDVLRGALALAPPKKVAGFDPKTTRLGSKANYFIFTDHKEASLAVQKLLEARKVNLWSRRHSVSEFKTLRDGMVNGDVLILAFGERTPNEAALAQYAPLLPEPFETVRAKSQSAAYSVKLEKQGLVIYIVSAASNEKLMAAVSALRL